MQNAKNSSSLNIAVQVETADKRFAVVPEGDFCVIGRNDECDVVIKDESISHRHALIESTEGDGVVIRDLHSTNGVYINGRKIEKEEVPVPSELKMGNVKVSVLNADEVQNDFGEESGISVSKTGGYYYRRGGREYGPFSFGELRSLVKAGRLHRTDTIWNGKSEEWLQADNFRALFDSSEMDEAGGNSKNEERTLANEPHKTFSDEEGDITCPHCWYDFRIEDFLFVARHQDLTGDPVLGPEAQQRFLPSRFTPEGHAVDSQGLPCPDRACPRCHLRIPSALTEMPPLFASIVGAAGSGKSYFLTAMIWKLRNTLLQKFAMVFSDTDAVSNQIINECEEKLFFSSDPEEIVSLEKTELHGEMYNQLLIDDMLTHFPKPFMFSVSPSEHHPYYEDAVKRMSRTLVLYDNAGEHFEPGMDSVDNPTTQHILYSDTVLFVFDPTKDARFREKCKGSKDPQMKRGARVQRQEILLTEMINRIQKYTGTSRRQKSERPLIVIVPKADIWLHMLEYDIPAEPWVWDSETKTCALDIDTIMSTSLSVRAVLEDVSPELVSTAESYSRDVIFLPNSALGQSPEVDEESGTLGIKPKDIKPFWITVPMLYHFYRYGLIPRMARSSRSDEELLKPDYSVSGDLVYVDMPGCELPLQVPVSYLGYRLRCPVTGQWFELPERQKKQQDEK